MKFNLYIFITLFLFGINTIYSMARYADIEELVTKSDLIAIITINTSKEINDNIKFGNWEYSQKNTFRVNRILKNHQLLYVDTLSSNTIWARKNFTCAWAEYSPGTYLVFLEKVKENEWITLNHGFGGLPISEKDSVKYFGFYFNEIEKYYHINKVINIIINSLSTTELATLKIEINKKRNLNKSNYHELKFNVIDFLDVSPDNWPKSYLYNIKGIINSNDKVQDEKFVIPGEYKISGKWDMGYFYIKTIVN